MRRKGTHLGRRLLAGLAALGLIAAMGCQSTPEAEADPAPLDPYEEPAGEPAYEEHSAYDDPAAYGTPTPGMAELPTSAEDVTEEQIESFASAYVSVMELRMTYEPQLQTATSEEEALAIQEEAETQIIAAVEAEDLTVDEFNAIADLLAYDETLRDRVQSEIDSILN